MNAHTQGGAALICGSALTFSEDFAEARLLYPRAAIIGVNDASSLVRLDHLFTLHPEKIQRWLDRHKRKFGARPMTHSAMPKPVQGIDHWWSEATGQGTSGWSAAKMARLMGYNEITLCGIPMDAVGYTRRGPARAFMKPHVLEHYRNYIASDVAYHPFVRSMSGWTRDLLGAPQW